MDDHSDSRPVHPGRILLERAMRPLGISRNQLARDIDVPVGRISDITNGKRGITADTALRLGRYFGVPPQLWLRLQAEYDLHAVRTSTWGEIEPRVRVLDTARTRLSIDGGSAPPPAEATTADAVGHEPPRPDGSPADEAAAAETPDGVAVPPVPPGRTS